jgi:CRP-like cAMP-binding protein
MSRPIQNLLLSGLKTDDFALLEPHLQQVSVSRSEVIIHPNVPITHAYFVEDGIASIVADTKGGRRIEVGLYGRDGMGGTALLLGADRTPHENFFQVAGSALRIASGDLSRALQQSPTLHNLLLRYVQAVQLQTAHTALANASYTLEERLARWLLMSHDRIDGDDVPLTHEFLSIMLGVRRPGVTLALQSLEKAKVIRRTRAIIRVGNRSKLERIAGGSYGPPEAEYSRLITRFGRSTSRKRTSKRQY